MPSTSDRRTGRRKDEYLVWIEVEKYSGDIDEHYPVEGLLNFSSTARFNTLDEAVEFAREMHAAFGGS